VPTASIFRLPKVATPCEAKVAATAEPPSKTPLLRTRETVEPSVVTRLPKPSWTCTVTAGLRGAPAVPLVGGCPKTNLLAAAGLTATSAEVAVKGPASVLKARFRVSALS
jgi:hypothetical protein